MNTCGSNWDKALHRHEYLRSPRVIECGNCVAASEGFHWHLFWLCFAWARNCRNILPWWSQFKIDCFIKGNSLMRPVRAQAVCVNDSDSLFACCLTMCTQKMGSKPASWGLPELQEKKKSNYMAFKDPSNLSILWFFGIFTKWKFKIDSAFTLREQCPQLNKRLEAMERK